MQINFTSFILRDVTKRQVHLEEVLGGRFHFLRFCRRDDYLIYNLITLFTSQQYSAQLHFLAFSAARLTFLRGAFTSLRHTQSTMC